MLRYLRFQFYAVCKSRYFPAVLAACVIPLLIVPLQVATGTSGSPDVLHQIINVAFDTYFSISVAVISIYLGSKLYAADFGKNLYRTNNKLVYVLSALLVLFVFVFAFMVLYLLLLTVSFISFQNGVLYANGSQVGPMCIYLLLYVLAEVSFGSVVMLIAALVRHAVIPLGVSLVYIPLKGFIYEAIDVFILKKETYIATKFFPLGIVQFELYNNLSMQLHANKTPQYGGPILTILIYLIVAVGLTVLVYATKKRRGYYN